MKKTEKIFDKVVTININDDAQERMLYHLNSTFLRLGNCSWKSSLDYESGIIYGMLFTLEVIGVLAPSDETMLNKILQEKVSELEKRFNS